MGIRPLARWDYGFEIRCGGGSPSLVIVVCCKAEFSATGRSLVQRTPTECGVSGYDQGSQWKRRNGTKGVEP